MPRWLTATTAPSPGLRAEDFVLREEGRPRDIRNFANEDMPVDVVLLLDVSGSMRSHVERIASAANQALRVLGPDDRVALMVFDRAARLRMPFRNSRSDVERGFESLLEDEDFNGGTDITRALLEAARYSGREGRREARRAIVIVTDDQTERDRDEAAVSRALASADTVLSALIAPDAMRHRSIQSNPWPGSGPLGGPLGGIILGRRGPGPSISRTRSAGTEEIARRSGGDSMAVERASALEETLARIRQRYALHFYLGEDARPGEERNIDVQLTADARRRYPDADVRYRRVYLTPGGASADAAGYGEPRAAGSASAVRAPARRRLAPRGGAGDPRRAAGAASSQASSRKHPLPWLYARLFAAGAGGAFVPARRRRHTALHTRRPHGHPARIARAHLG